MAAHFSLERVDLADDVVHGIVEPLVEGNCAITVLVDAVEVLFALGQTDLKIIKCETTDFK